MKVFAGIGLGPIQTGIFLAGASRGKFDRIVIAEVDEKLKNAINNDGGKVTINIAYPDHVEQETIANVEVYSPMIPAEREKLVAAAAVACEFSTALPSVKFFPPSAEWLREGFRRNPAQRRFLYTAENNNHAAEELEKAVGEAFPQTYYLNTVVGKMSGVVPAAACAEQHLAPLSASADRGHLVEAFNKIYISDAPEIEKRAVANLYVKKDLIPFEEAKLYGHNAVHFLLGTLGKTKNCEFMSDIAQYPELIAVAREAFKESGRALCKKYAGLDELFTEAGFNAYSEDLLQRMVNPFLKDAVARITRDLNRKLAWDDRVIGTMRLIVAQGFTPANFAKGARLAAEEEFGGDLQKMKTGLASLWPTPWSAEAEKIWQLIIQ